MYALAAKRRDTREVGQACRGTPGKYAKHTEGLKAFITRKGKKKVEDLLPPRNMYAHRADYLSRCYAISMQHKRGKLMKWQDFDNCLRQCIGIAMFNFWLFIYLTSACGKHRCWSHLHDGNPRTPVHCRGEGAVAFTPEQGTTVKCCWAAAGYWTLNFSDMPFWCAESFVRNCKVLHVYIFGYLSGKRFFLQ